MLNLTNNGGNNQVTAAFYSNLICRNCHASNLSGSIFCDRCSKPLRQSTPSIGFASRELCEPINKAGDYVARQFQRTSSNAIYCLIAGILGWTFLPLIDAVLAVIFGNRAKREIRAANGALGGQTFVTIGMAPGIAELGLFCLGIIGSTLAFIIPILAQFVLRYIAFS